MRALLFISSLLLLALTPYEYSRLPKVKVLVVYRENVGDLWRFMVNGGDYKVVDLRVGIAFLPTELQNRLRSWVNRGGGALVYCGADDETNSWPVFMKEEDVEYAELSRWIPVVLKKVPNVSHPLLKGVEKIKLYMHRVPDVKNQQGKVPLFQTQDGKNVVFAQDYGRGRVVFLPTGPLLPYFPINEYDNERFFINIYQWLAGNKVPD